MEQKQLLKNGEAWIRIRQFVARYNGLRGHFLAFSAAAATLAEDDGGFGNDIRVTQHLDDNYFDVTFMGRTFRFRFVPRPEIAGDAQIVVTAVDMVTKKEGPIFNDILFTENARTLLKNPDNGDPLMLNERDSARYFILSVIHNAV
jgi:hypothetical protein